ncbi:MAG: SH3 domain-containing protein [Planctomycetota bacterium]
MLAAILLACASTPGVDQAAIDAYRRGNHESAKSLWIAALESGKDESGSPLPSRERARILYDLGNASFRSDEPLEAVGWYTASLRLRPRDSDTWTNLEHARRTAKLEPADRGDLGATMWRLVTSITLAESEWLALAGAALWAVLLAAEALRGGRLFRRLSVAATFLALAGLVPWVIHRGRAARDTILVIAAEEGGTGVHSEPRPDAAVVANAPAGAELLRTDELPGWVKVVAEDGTAGWIESGAAFALRR